MYDVMINIYKVGVRHTYIEFKLKCIFLNKVIKFKLIGVTSAYIFNFFNRAKFYMAFLT